MLITIITVSVTEKRETEFKKAYCEDKLFGRMVAVTNAP